ncbi:hypothetical protein DSL72_001981 [Monilinia vaccinii-corymbosi]|uniref:SET domain-containing protein n=1 Tax=Monilinia vaccinii-corymbosi TaxID=61207 RepID=A0A8A3PBD8_9HELO|nr:hypothetical protein DSL72_001981 [Monilinia vaccinii-corymbosi]
MGVATVYALPLAEACHFEEWFEIAMKWKAGKKYKWTPPAKEKRVDERKGERAGLVTPPDTPLKPKFSSSLNSSVTVPTFSITTPLALPVSEPLPLVPPSLTSSVVVAVNSDPAPSWVAEVPSHPKSLAPPCSPPSPPPERVSTFENEFFEVRTSPKGGLGCFARTDIKMGTEIHSEEPLFISGVLQVHYNFEQLTPKQQAAYLNLHGWHGLANHKIVAIFQTNRYVIHLRSSHLPSIVKYRIIQLIHNCHSFHINGSKCGIFLNSSRFNHACPGFRNCSYNFDKELNKMAFTALDDIEKGQELTIAYASTPNDLYQNYGFFCDCPGCPSWDVQYQKWKFEDDLRRRETLETGNNVQFEREAYQSNPPWKDDVYEW